MRGQHAHERLLEAFVERHELASFEALVQALGQQQNCRGWRPARTDSWSPSKSRVPSTASGDRSSIDR